MKKYIVRKSIEPNEEGDYIVFLESKSKNGFNYGRIFKGSKEECLEMKKKLDGKDGKQG